MTSSEMATRGSGVKVPSAGVEPRPVSQAYRYTVVGILALAYTFNFLDRQILAILAEPVKRELHLSDTQIGLLTGSAFAVFYAGFGVPIAMFADRSNRTRIVALACLAWSLFSAASGLAANFVQLAALRMGVGIGEAGGTTPSYAIVSDYFPPERRAKALALFSLGVPIGTAFGAALGGGVAAHYGWRAAFFAAGLPGILIAVLILLVVREPVRGGQDRAAADAPQPGSLGEVAGMFLHNPVLRWTAVGVALAAFAGYGVLAWTPSFLIRRQGMSLGQLAGAYSLSIGLAMAAGTWLSGYLADRLSGRRPDIYALIPLWGGLVSLPFVVTGYLVHSWTLGLGFLSVGFAFGILYLAPALTVVQNTVPARVRSTAAAFLLLVLNLVGLGGGPLFVGVVSDALKPRFGADSLQIALLSVLAVSVLGIGAWLMSARALSRAARTAAGA